MVEPCPHLPQSMPEADWRVLAAHRKAHRGAKFYVDCLAYGQTLWRHGKPARAILCLDRAFGADLQGDEPELQRWPMPYEALKWMLNHAPAGVFLGNPRVHFQHYADRMNEPRRERRKWRAWACWALARAVMPELPGDPRHKVEEPSMGQIEAKLGTHGLPGETIAWKDCLGRAS